MNERVPDSSGLPLRAMVMVLLFLGVIFLLVGLQAMSSGGSGDDDDAPAAPMTTTTSSKPAVPKAEVRVYTAGGEEAAATRVGTGCGGRLERHRGRRADRCRGARHHRLLRFRGG